MKHKDEAKSQRRAFEQAARALGCDESEERFDAALKKVAAHKPLEKKSGERRDKNKNAS
jgi:hypothetical protein